MTRWSGRGACTAALTLVVVWLGGCGTSRAAPTLCASAEEYFRYGQQILGGRSGHVATGTRAKRDLAGLLAALEDLAVTVPVRLRDEVEFSQRVWSDIDSVARRHDYGTGQEDVTQQEYERLMARYEPDQDKGVRLTSYLRQRCRDSTSTPVPSDPAQGSG